MLCDDIKCNRLTRKAEPFNLCRHLTLAGMIANTRRGYCPFVDDGPRKPVKKLEGKVRSGQQKQKRKDKHES